MGEYLKARGIAWTYFRDEPSLRLLEEQPDHGCDLCSRYRRRAVYEIAADLGCNVIAFGHTADDFCEALLRNTMFTGKLSALPPVTHSRNGDYRLIRPLVFVTEDITTRLRRSRACRWCPAVVRSGPAPCGAPCATCSPNWSASTRISRRPCFPPWETWIPAACWITRFLNLDGDAGTSTTPRNCFRLSRNCNRAWIDPQRVNPITMRFSPYQAHHL